MDFNRLRETLERDGESTVRERLAAGLYGERKTEFIEHWLSSNHSHSSMRYHAVPDPQKSAEFVHRTLLWEQDVGGSNPSTPTSFSRLFQGSPGEAKPTWDR